MDGRLRRLLAQAPAPQVIEPWLFRLDLPPGDIVALRRLLAPDEAARADAFRYPLHRDRFIARRGQLRLLLASVVAGRPEALRFRHGPWGKPFLIDDGSPRFSTSSAGATGLCVLAPDEIGCDIACEEPETPDIAIARRFFTPREQRALLAVPASRRSLLFLDIWARKEAFLKAAGVGLRRSPDSFEVPLGEAEPGTPLGIEEDWAFLPLRIGGGCRAALVARSSADLRVAPVRTAWLPLP